MSYILEALRKSERQRREVEEQPLARLAAVRPSRERSRWRIALLTFSALTNIAVLVYLMAPAVSTQRKATSPVAEQAARPNGAEAAQPAVAISDRRSVTADVPAGTESKEIVASRAVAQATAKSKPPVASSAGKAASPSRPTRDNPRQRANTTSAERGAPFDAEFAEPESGDLEQPVRAEVLPAPERPSSREPVEPADGLPRPRINVYAYTARVDGDRFVIIQNRKYREGDRIEGGPVVRRIEENGMTLEFAGQTYRIPRP